MKRIEQGSATVSDMDMVRTLHARPGGDQQLLAALLKEGAPIIDLGSRGLRRDASYRWTSWQRVESMALEFHWHREVEVEVCAFCGTEIGHYDSKYVCEGSGQVCCLEHNADGKSLPDEWRFAKHKYVHIAS